MLSRRRVKSEKRVVQVTLLEEEYRRLRMLCAELGITIQEFMRRILRGALPEVESELER